MTVKIVFFDCDGTLTRVRSSWQHVHERLGLWDDRAYVFQDLFRAGSISYHEFCARDASLWKGLPAKRIQSIIDDISYHEGVAETLQTLNSAGIVTAIISTGLSRLVDKAKRELGVTFAVANELIELDGLLTGDIRINVDHDQKGFWARKILAETNLRKEEAAAVGDSEGDRGMFEEVAIAIGYRPAAGILPLLDHALYDGSFTQILELIRPPGQRDAR
jgi:phosphoserine phosphatase